MRAIKVLKDLYALLPRRSIDIKVFQTFTPCETNARAPHTIAAGASEHPILKSLSILHILIQT